MQLDLNDGETELLRQVLDSAFRELKYEIADTDTRRYKEDLKNRLHVLESVLDRVGGPLPDAD
jgi:hypothetical protein